MGDTPPSFVAHYSVAKLIAVLAFSLVLSIGWNLPGAGEGLTYTSALYGKLSAVRYVATAIIAFMSVVLLLILVAAVAGRPALVIDDETLTMQSGPRRVSILRMDIDRISPMNSQGIVTIHYLKMAKKLTLPVFFYKKHKAALEELEKLKPLTSSPI